MSNINNNFLVNLSQAIGISYEMKNNVLGDATSPSSAIFNVNQIASILAFGKPIFGVYENDASFATITFVNNGLQVNFEFSPGIVFYQRNLINIPSQSIPIRSEQDYAGKKLFKFYLDYNDFELSSTVFNCTVVSVSGSSIVVDQLPSTNYLNNFRSVNINNYLFGISSIDVTTNTILLTQDPNGYASAGTTLTLIFQPVIRYFTTFASTGNPPDIDIPASGLIIASAEVEISGSVGSLTYSCPVGAEKLFETFPIYTDPQSFFPSFEAYSAFLRSVNNSIRAFSIIQNYEIESNLTNSYLTYTTGIATNQQNFDEYWHSQPFQPTGLFQYGTGFQGLQKTDFDPRFKDFYYYYQGIDLTRNYAIFRGDIYGGNAYVGQALGGYDGSVSIKNLVDFTGNSTITNGTYSYGISAVTSSGEYVPKFTSDANFYFNQRVNNYIGWSTSLNVNNLLFYHVYKNIKEANGFQQQRITSPFEVNSATLNDVILAPNSTTPLGISVTNFAIKIKNSSSESGIVGGIAFNAFITNSSPLCGIQSCIIKNAGENYIQPYAVISGDGVGAEIRLSTSLGGGIGSALVSSFGSGYLTNPSITVFDAVSNSGGNGAEITPVLSQLSCGIFTGNTLQPIGTSIATLQSIPIASITSSYIMNMPIQGANFVGLNTNQNYWAKFSMNIPYTLTSSSQYLKFRNSTGFSTSYATSIDGINWITGTTNAQVAKLGFSDQGETGTIVSSRGVYLSDDQAAYPSRIQLYVPALDLNALGYSNVGAGAVNVTNGTIISTSPIQNSMTVYVLAENTTTGIQSTLVGSIPKNTERGTSILLGNESDLYDKVLDVFIVPNLTEGVNFIPNTTVINWTIYDLFTVDSVP